MRTKGTNRGRAAAEREREGMEVKTDRKSQHTWPRTRTHLHTHSALIASSITASGQALMAELQRTELRL